MMQSKKIGDIAPYMKMRDANYVSIIIAAYNSGDYLAKCLESLLAQTYKSVQIVVVYRESSDNTETVLNRYEERVKIIKQTGKSPANARNLGIAHCNGVYIAFCDADDIFSAEKIEKQINFMREREVDLVYSDFYMINNEGKALEKIETPDWDFDRWLRSGYIALSTVLIRREALINAKCFDEKWSSSEDFDLLIRLSKCAKLERIPEFLACRRIHKHNLSRSVHKTLLSRSRIYMSHGYITLGITSYLKGVVYSPLFYFLVDHPALYRLIKRIRSV